MNPKPPLTTPGPAAAGIPAAPAASPPHHRRLRSWIRRLARSALLVYLGLCIVFYLLQTWMIFPGAATQGQRHAVIQAGPDSELVHLTTADGERIVALFGPALTADGQPRPDAARRPTIIYFYGNGMCLADSWGEFKKFRRLGANVLIPEFVGYGMSSGRPGESGCYATADAAYAHLLTRDDIDPRRIVPMGWSLGAAVAIDLAWRKPVAGVAVFSGFTSMSDLADRLLPFLPNSLMLRHRFESRRKIAEFHCPTFISHGQRDRTIPCRMGEQLAAAAKGRPLTYHVIDGADHNDIFERGEADLFPALQIFLDTLPPRAVRKP